MSRSCSPSTSRSCATWARRTARSGTAAPRVSWFPPCTVTSSCPRCSAITCRRLPQGKQAAIDAYRDALEECGIDTAPWWERQLALCLLGALVQFGWEKALGGYDEELAWWESQAVAAQRFLV